MPKRSAGLLMFRRNGTAVGSGIEVFLVHSGGPFWAKKQQGAWSIPKGEYDEAEPPLTAALREFQEETGFTPQGSMLDLGSVRQAGGKLVSAWAFEGDADPAALRSNLCEIEWPPRSKRRLQIPEVDEARWFCPTTAREFMVGSQLPLLDRLLETLAQH